MPPIGQLIGDKVISLLWERRISQQLVTTRKAYGAVNERSIGQGKLKTMTVGHRVHLSPECAELIDAYRAMLRTLKIPGEWLVRYGLAAMGEQVPDVL